jgi:hypothetical protein
VAEESAHQTADPLRSAVDVALEAELEAALALARAQLAIVRGSLTTLVTYLARPLDAN